jgi:hypothetical protein
MMLLVNPASCAVAKTRDLRLLTMHLVAGCDSVAQWQMRQPMELSQTMLSVAQLQMNMPT